MLRQLLEREAGRAEAIAGPAPSPAPAPRARRAPKKNAR
jgi:hypothetical protein